MRTAHYISIVATVVALIVPSPSPGQDGPASAVADGQPWTSSTGSGRKMNITFFPDGRAKINFGRISKAVTWQPTDDGLCLMGMPGGDKCLRLEKTTTGYIAYDGDAAMMTLSRG